MTEVEAKKPQESLQDRLAQVVELLHRHKVVEDLTHRQEGQHHDRVENLVHRQNLVELQRKLEELHPADIAASSNRCRWTTALRSGSWSSPRTTATSSSKSPTRSGKP